MLPITTGALAPTDTTHHLTAWYPGVWRDRAAVAASRIRSFYGAVHEMVVASATTVITTSQAAHEVSVGAILVLALCVELLGSMILFADRNLALCALLAIPVMFTIRAAAKLFGRLADMFLRLTGPSDPRVTRWIVAASAVLIGLAVEAHWLGDVSLVVPVSAAIVTYFADYWLERVARRHGLAVPAPNLRSWLARNVL